MQVKKNHRESQPAIIDCESYLSPAQLANFERLLRRRRDELLGVSLSMKNDLKESGFCAPDLYDVAAAQSEMHVELQGLKRHSGQIAMIDRALARIKDGSYGYCEMTGDPIGLKRLEIHPTATLCVEAQEMVERSAGVMVSSASQINGYDH